jgi:tripartite-type tricarboxylate transporter receptor subunit TctC
MKSIFLTLFLILGSQSPLFAQTNYYQGKQIKSVVGFTAGGFYDRWARLLARFMPKYIPGNPEMIVQNMPGAGGRRQLCLQCGQTGRADHRLSK